MLAPRIFSSVTQIVFCVGFLRLHLSLRNRSMLDIILKLEFCDRDFRPVEEYVTRISKCDVRLNHIAEYLFTCCVQHRAATRIPQKYWDPSILLFED